MLKKRGVTFWGHVYEFPQGAACDDVFIRNGIWYVVEGVASYCWMSFTQMRDACKYFERSQEAMLLHYFYRGFEIIPTNPMPPIPTRQFDWSWIHPDYDGPGDNRCGYAADVDACKAAVDEWFENNSSA